MVFVLRIFCMINGECNKCIGFTGDFESECIDFENIFYYVTVVINVWLNAVLEMLI